MRWLILLIVCIATPVHAEEIQDPPAPTPPTEYAERAMETYFRGEIKGGFTLMGMGVVGLAAGGTMLAASDRDSLKGASYPLLGFGLAHLAAGVFVNLSSLKRIRGFAHQRDPAAWLSREQKRMRGVSKQFRVLEIVEAVGIVGGIGLGIYGRREDRPTLMGAGFALAGELGATLVFDFVAADRAKSYRIALGRIEF